MLLPSDAMVNPKATHLSQHLSNLPKLDKTHFVSTFVRDQSFHAKSYVLEGHAAVSHWDVASLGDGSQAQPGAFGTPVLKPRVPTKIILEPVRRIPSSLTDYKNDLLGSLKTLTEDRLNHPTQNENKRKRPGSSVAKRSVPKSNKQTRTPNNKPPFKIRDSDIDIIDEQAWLCRERRERKRAKQAIINPSRSSDASNETVSDAKARRSTKNTHSRANMPAGFALMHGFTATNVGASRLTIKPSASIGVFSKGKASATTRTNRKSAKKDRRSTRFSERGFLNKGDKERPELSNIGSPEDRPKKFVITNRRHLKARPSENKKRTPCSLPGNESKSVMSVDRLSISHLIKAPSSPNPLLKATLAGSTVWDIEVETASLLSPAPPPEKRSVVLEIRNRPWNNSPGDQSAEPDDSHDRTAPRPETLTEELDNLVADAKSPSPSLGPSQSASQHGRFYPRTDGTIPRAHVDSKYFLPQISHAARTEPQNSFEKQPFDLVTVFLPKQTSEKMTAGYFEAISPQSRLSHPISLNDHAEVSNLARYLDKQVIQRRPEIASCLHSSSTEQLIFGSPQPDVKVQDVGPDSCMDSELVDRRCSAWRDSECSVDCYTQDIPLRPSVDYGDGLYAVDVPEDIVPSYSRMHDAYEEYLYHDYGRAEGTNVIIQEYDLARISEAEHSDECMVEPGLTFSGKGEHGLVEGHIDGYDNNGEYEAEIFDDEHEALELDDEWDQSCGDILNDGSHIFKLLSQWNPGSMSSNDLDDTFLSDSEPVHSAVMFSQGRALLVGTTQEDQSASIAVHTRRPLLSLVEADVAKSLRNHWLPQKL